VTGDRRWPPTAAVGIAVAIVVAITAALWVAGNGSFRESYLANLFATLIGVGVAVPLGLAIDRAFQTLEHNGRRCRLLQAIRNDLVSTGEDLDSRRPRNGTTVPFLGSGLWEAVSAAGQINDIHDPEQLRAIARAYDRIDVTRYLERQVWELTVGTVVSDPITTPLGARPPRPQVGIALGVLAEQDEHTKAAIDHALERIAVGGSGTTS
jgi:hypothetical protein